MTENEGRPTDPGWAPPPGSGQGRSRRRWLPALTLLPIALLGGVATAIVFALSSVSGTRWVVERLVASQAGALRVEALTGTAWRGLSAARVSWSDAALAVEATEVKLRLDWSSLLRRMPVLDELRARALVMAVPASDSPAKLPDTLRLAFDWQVRQLHIDSIEWRQGAEAALQLGPIDLSVGYGAGWYRVEAIEAQGRGLRFSDGRIELGDSAPFAFRASVRMNAEPTRMSLPNPPSRTWLPGRTLTGEFDLQGSLTEAQVSARLSYAGASAQGRWALEPFSGRFDRPLEARFEGVDPSRWLVDAPVAALSGSVHWRPAQAALDFEISNDGPGRLDQGRIPIERARGELSWQGEVVRVADLELGLSAGGAVRGALRIDPAQRLRVLSHDLPAVDAQVEVHLPDLSALSADWPPTRLEGQLETQGERLRLTLPDPLGDRSLTIGADFRLAGEQVLIERLDARLAYASLRLSGAVGLTDTHRFDVAGNLDGVDPGRVLERLGLAVPAQAMGTLNGELRGHGEIGGRTPQADARLVLHDSRLAGQRLGAAVTGSYRHRAQRLALDGHFDWGGNSLQLRGAVGEPGERLHLAARFDRLDRLDRRLSGSARIEADLVGPPTRPRLSARLFAPRLTVAEAFSLDDGEAMVEGADVRGLAGALLAQAGDPAAAGVAGAATAGTGAAGARAAGTAGAAPAEPPPTRLRLAAREVRAAGERLQSIRLEMAGGIDHHTFQAALRLAGQEIALAGEGRVAAVRPDPQADAGTQDSARVPGESIAADSQPGPRRWSARLDSLGVDGAVAARLLGSARLDLGRGRVRLQGLELGSAGGVLAIEEAGWSAAGFVLRGAARALPLRPLVDWLGAGPGPATGPGVADARIDAAERIRNLRLDARWSLAGHELDSLDGRMVAALRVGEPHAGPGARAGAAASAGAAAAAASTVGSQIDGGGEPRARVSSDDSVIGDNRIDVRIVAGRLDGEANLAIPSLRFSRRYTAPDWALDGELWFSGRIGGHLRSPELVGALRAERLTLFNRLLGWRLRDGRIDARFDGRELAIDTIRFASGDGSVTIAGALRLSERPTGLVSAPHPELPVEGRLRLEARRLPVPLGVGQRLLLSGVTELVAAGGQLTWRGRLRADEGLIELRSGGVPELPADVRVIGDPAPVVPRGAVGRAVTGPIDAGVTETGGATLGRAASGSASSPGWTPRVGADLVIQLGDSLRVRGGGVEARLAGELTLVGMLPAAPRVGGLVDVPEGTFNAYGRQLRITRGLIRFAAELDNPVLDIIAMRRDQQVEAGVAVTGTARAPRIRLVSEPDLPDAQKLSWLVLGAALDDVSNAGQARALSEAAFALLGRSDEGLVASLTQRLGVDAVSVGASGAGSRDRIGSPRLAPPATGATTTSPTTAGGLAGTARQDVVTVSKRLGSRLTLSYERGLSGLWNLVRLQYEISNRLSLRAQSGSENALDLLYFWWFD